MSKKELKPEAPPEPRALPKSKRSSPPTLKWNPSQPGGGAPPVCTRCQAAPYWSYLLALVLVLEHFVGLADVLEAGLGARVLVHVRVELAGELAVDAPDLRRGGVLGDPQRLVVVLVFHPFSVPRV